MSRLEKQKSYESKRFSISKKHHGCNGHGKDDHVCVEEVLEAILKAQRKVEENHKKKYSSCKDAIKELLEEPKKPRKNTIPFILLCGCEPFKATGVASEHKSKKLECHSSYIFKIKDLKGSCAELELLTFKSKKDACKKEFSLCDQVDHEEIDDLEKTGVCINVDLSCFCGVTCLPAVRL